MSRSAEPGGAGPIASEADIVACLAPLTARFPGAFALTDDCAAFAPEPGCELVLTTDAVVEGVHVLDGDAASDVAWKALAVNVSDLVAKGARPRVYLMALAFPDAPLRAWLEDFARGLGEAQRRFGIELAGGDTDRRPGPLSITITAVGEVPAGRMVRRGAARPGDVLYVSGRLGDAALGLALRQGDEAAAGWRLAPADRSALVYRALRPEPRIGLAPVLVAHARAAMDISDGLAKDLARMAAASGCGARIEAARLPASAAVVAVAASDPIAARTAQLAGGEDYEVLAAVDPLRAKAFEEAASTAGVRVTAIGSVVEGDGITIVGRDGTPISLERPGWDHF